MPYCLLIRNINFGPLGSMLLMLCLFQRKMFFVIKYFQWNHFFRENNFSENNFRHLARTENERQRITAGYFRQCLPVVQRFENEKFKLRKWFTKFKNGNHFFKTKKAFLVKPKIYSVAPNTKKYEKHFLENILCQNKQSLNINSFSAFRCPNTLTRLPFLFSLFAIKYSL